MSPALPLEIKKSILSKYRAQYETQLSFRTLPSTHPPPTQLKHFWIRAWDKLFFYRDKFYLYIKKTTTSSFPYNNFQINFRIYLYLKHSRFIKSCFHKIALLANLSYYFQKGYVYLSLMIVFSY